MKGRYRGTRDNPTLETIERLAWAFKVSEAEVIGVYPALVRLNKTEEIPFEHYALVRDFSVDVRPATLQALKDRYDFQKVVWGEPEENPPRRRKKTRAAQIT